MSRGSKRKSPDAVRERRPAITPGPFFPAAIRVPGGDFKFTDSQFEQLERAGDVTLSQHLREELLTLADAWIHDLRLRLTPRPKQFWSCLDKMDKAFLQAEKACFWDHGLEYHLVHWAMETTVEDAKGFPVALAALEHQLQTVRNTVIRLIACLPEDPGRQRPFDDERRIIFLADIFERAGGKAVAYASSYYEEGSIANTSFRKFAQRFYLMLPAEDKRDPGGMDQALRDALAERREQRRASP
jgi:hypothetical protein